MTDRTPIQFSDDDRQLLRQIAGIVQDTHFRLSAVETRLSHLETQVSAVETRLSHLETQVSTVETRLSALETQVSAVETRLSALEQRVDERLQDTRPMWEALNARLDRIEAETNTRFTAIEQRLDRIEIRLDQMATKEDLGDMSRSVLKMFSHFVNLHDRYDARLEKIEKR
jgi:chromosome segregation ATPase